MRPRKPQRYERYAFQDSPWVQDLTQRDLAELLGYTKTQLGAYDARPSLDVRCHQADL